MSINAHKGNYSESRDTWKVNSEEAVLYGEACRCGTGAYPKLMVDGVEVPLDGAGAKEESLGNLGVGEPFGHQPEHLHLPRCQSARMLLGRGGEGRSRLFSGEGVLDSFIQPHGSPMPMRLLPRRLS